MRPRDAWATSTALVLFLIGATRGEIVLSAAVAVAAFGAIELIYPLFRTQLDPLLDAADNRRALLESGEELARIREACGQVPAGRAGQDELMRLSGKLERAHQLIG